MKLAHTKPDTAAFTGNAIVIGVIKNQPLENQKLGVSRAVLDALAQGVSSLAFDPETGQLFTLPDGKRFVIAVGLGEKKLITAETYRKASAAATWMAKTRCQQRIGLHFPSAKTPEELTACLEGAALAAYAAPDYRKTKTPRQQQARIEQIELLSDHPAAATIIARTRIACEAVHLVRDLVNKPSNQKAPLEFAKIAEKESKAAGLTCKVISETELKKMKMGGIIGVSAGSHEPPCLVQLEYAPPKAKRTVALVGKGVTFDSGGLNLKPWEGMLTMKQDMAGAATVLGTMLAAARLQLPMRLIGLLPLVENLPGNRAYKDGDILTAFNGKTIEVIHTDAEGRIILADALSYAESLSPDCIVDLATLTGAQNVALGRYFIGATGNDPKLLSQLLDAGNATFERGWALPLIPEWDEQIKSDSADVRNISKAKGEAGTLIGGAFLRQFVEKTPWVHLDIASTAFVEIPDASRPYLPPYGGTGVGVRLLLQWLANA
jgi:leucyl aminopeptidase